MEDTRRDTRCWEAGGQPGIPVCSREPGRGHSAGKAGGNSSDSHCLKEGKWRDWREESEPERGGTCGPQAPPLAAALVKRYGRGFQFIAPP